MAGEWASLIPASLAGPEGRGSAKWLEDAFRLRLTGETSHAGTFGRP